MNDDILVPRRTLDALDEAIEAISVARRELSNAAERIYSIAPSLAILLDDDILRLAQRRQKIADIRASVAIAPTQPEETA